MAKNFEKTLNAISLQPFDRFWWNLVRRCTLGHPKWRSTNNFKISKSKMADGGHIKNRKIAISQKPFGRFWRNFARWHILILRGFHLNKKSNFKNPRWQTAVIFKIVKYDIPATVWPILVKFGTMMHIRPPNVTVYQKIQNFKIQDGGCRPSWKYKNRDISEIV